MSLTRCVEHCASGLAHLAKVLAMPYITKNEVLKIADSGCASYFKRLALTQGSQGELIEHILLGRDTNLHAPIRVEWPKLCMLKVVPWTAWTDFTGLVLEARVWIIQPKI